MNTQTHQGEVVILIYHQILVTNKQVIVLQLDGRIKNQILGVTCKGLRSYNTTLNTTLKQFKITSQQKVSHIAN